MGGLSVLLGNSIRVFGACECERIAHLRRERQSGIMAPPQAVRGLIMSAFSQTEAPITIDGPVGPLEARARDGSQAGDWRERELVAVVCHPHPLHGGTMNNKVVTTLARTYHSLGVPVVRFNFRGVGESAGTFDEARGEVDDLLAVIDWAREQRPGADLLLAGFSFGSSVAAQAAHRVQGLAHLVLVAPPVERYPYGDEGRFACPVVVVQGDADDVVSPDAVYRWLETLTESPVLLRYPEAGHFFHGGLSALKKDLLACLVEQVPG